MTRLQSWLCMSTALLLTGCPDEISAPRDTGSSMAADESERIFDMPYLLRDLDNGLRVIIVDTGYPDIVTIQIPVQTGSRNEVEPGKSGFAHFFEHMMFRGTEAYPVEEYSSLLKNAGADQNAYTTDDYTNYHITFTKTDLEKIIELEADRFKNLKYTEEQFRTEALAVKGEYLKNYSNPLQKLIEVIRAASFSEHTYKHTTMGFLEDIEDMPNQLDYSQVFFDRWYRPEKAVVILAGDIDPEATFALVERYWGDWEPGTYDVDIPAEPAAAGPVYEHVEWEAPTQPWLIFAFHGPQFDPASTAMPSMDLISQIFFSESSELYQKLVIEEQLVDQFFTFFPDRKDPQLLYIAGRLMNADNAIPVRNAIIDTLVKIRTEPVGDKKLAETKSRLKYSFASRMDNSEDIGSILAAYVHFDRDPEVINTLYRTYDSLTAGDILENANAVFTDAREVLVTLSNDDALAGVADIPSIDDRVALGTSVRDADIDVLHMQSASSPLVDVSFLFNTGAAYDPPGKKGLATLTAAMITDGGSESRSIEEINQAMYPLAAGFSAQVDKEMIRLASGSVHRDNLDRWYALASDQLLSPGWREKDFERIRKQTSNAIRTNLVGNNDEELGKEMLYSYIYGADHPYGSLNLGVTDDLENITLEDVRAFYEANFTTDNLTVGLAGGYSDGFVTRLKQDLGRLPAAATPEVELSEPPPINGRHAVIVEKETPAVAVSFGFPITVRRGDPDWVALWLVRSWLGEHRSSNSHLYKRIREVRGMNYGDYAYIEYFPRGMFQFHPDANLGRQQQIFQIWLRPLRNNNDAHFATRAALYEIDELIRDGMTQEDLDSTRNFLGKFVSLLMKTQSRQLGYALDSEYYGTPAFAEYVRNGLGPLTLEDVNRVIRENLQLENVKFVFITKDAADLRDRLVTNQASAMEYNSEKPPELLSEDAVIQDLATGLTAGTVAIVAADDVFTR